MTPQGAHQVRGMHWLVALAIGSLSKLLLFPEEKPGSEAEQLLLGENKADAVDCPFLSFLISKGAVSISPQWP